MESIGPKLNVKVLANEQLVSQYLADVIVDTANDASSRTGLFSIGLSGGSAAKYLSEHLPNRNTDWSKWKVFFCDERHVAADDPDSTYGFYLKHLFQNVNIPSDHIFSSNANLTVEEAAADYELKLKSVFGNTIIPQFDVLLLGMGPDGHTCSLFPGHPLVDEKVKWVAAIQDSPKPPPERITLTMPVLLNTRLAVFVACGSGKAEIVKQVLEGNNQPPLPASLVRPTNGEVLWILDEAAASLLSARH